MKKHCTVCQMQTHHEMNREGRSECTLCKVPENTEDFDDGEDESPKLWSSDLDRMDDYMEWQTNN